MSDRLGSEPLCAFLVSISSLIRKLSLFLVCRMDELSLNYWVYVRFEDGDHVSLSTDVRDFDPAHSDDFNEDEVYGVFWQEGTKSFDGYYDGHIICMASKSLFSNVCTNSSC